MALHLIEGLDMWDQEVGKADVILLCGNYAFNKKDLGLSVGYGSEALTRFPGLADDLFKHFKHKRKQIKNLAPYIWGLILPEVVNYKGTLIGIWQIKEGPNHDVNMELVKYSIAMVCYMAQQYDRVVLEYPSKEIHKGDAELLYPVLRRVPEHCVFYAPGKPVEEINYQAVAQNYSGNFTRPDSQNSFHRR